MPRAMKPSCKPPAFVRGDTTPYSLWPLGRLPMFPQLVLLLSGRASGYGWREGLFPDGVRGCLGIRKVANILQCQGPAENARCYHCMQHSLRTLSHHDISQIISVRCLCLFVAAYQPQWALFPGASIHKSRHGSNAEQRRGSGTASCKGKFRSRICSSKGLATDSQ